LIEDLNDKDHSEDEGIEDYKIGGYTIWYLRYHPCHVGEILINRYVLIQKLGWGHFSTVWLAKDFKYGNYAAVKIMKSSPHYL
jgi:serine/threonine-protein kinase SRPK3